MKSTEEKPIVIITGSSGLLGGRLLGRLKNSFQVVGFDRDGQPQPPPEIECVCVDLTSDESVQRGLARVAFAYGREIAAIVHLAAYYDFSGKPSELYDEVNVRGTERLLGGLESGGFDCDLFVYSSSMLVHRPTAPGEPITESSPLEAKWDYPRSKMAAEQRIEELHGDTPVVVLRIAGVYTDHCDSIPISQQIHRIASKSFQGVVYPGDASHGQSFVHCDDVLAAIEAAVARRHDLPRAMTPLLIGEPSTPTYGEIQDRLGQLLHDKDGWPLQRIPKPLAKAGAWVQDKLPMEQFVKPWMIGLADDHYELDVAKAGVMLGWQPQHRLLDTLPDMIADLRRDPDAWYARHGLTEVQ